MGKKKKKTKHVETLTEVLKENKKLIFVKKDENTKVSIAEATQESAENVTAVPIKGIIAVSAEDVAGRKKLADSQIQMRYAKPVFTMYENALKMESKQTLMLTYTIDEAAEAINEAEKGSILYELSKRTNVQNILKKMDRPFNKLNKWISAEWFSEEPSDEPDIFVIHIPDVVMFTKTVKMNEVSESIRFDLLIQVVKTEKKITKIFKKDEDRYHEINHKLRESTIQLIKDLGIVCPNIQIDDAYNTLGNEISLVWKTLLEKEFSNDGTLAKYVDKLSFTTENSNVFIEFSNAMNELKDKIQKNVHID